ncbi:TetR family transcriptional regulator [Streptomyces cinereospinus]|uniref:TetR family transcriptional regulator n=1 Tax=Streptomyces cinereospinus TaxID=285561 RepID=A0ABV5N9J0_9ACTN
MARWEPGAAQRLQQAAMELFAERGFSNTTIPDITSRAGLTTRTFFRHYNDKREILFVGENELPEVVSRLFAQAPVEFAPIDVIVHGLQTVVASRLETQRAALRARREIINSDAGLQEREAHKLACLARAGTTGFAARGLTPPQAAIAASLAVTVYDVAFNQWLDTDDPTSFADAVTSAAATLKTVMAWPPGDGRSARPTL